MILIMITTLRRVVDLASLSLAVIVAGLICCSFTVWWPGVRLRPDAKMPGELRPGERRGPTPEEVLEWLNRNRPEAGLPPDAIE
jgi:hypothetical protein